MNYILEKPPTKTLDKHIEIISGFAFKSKDFGEEGNLPVIRIRDVKRGFSNTYYLGEYDNKYLIKNGDLLVGMDGEFNVGLWRGGDALLNQRVCKVRPLPTLNFDYLRFILPTKLKQIEDRTSFATVKHISARQIKNIEIPFPPLEEQKRIAAILDKADAIRQKKKKAIALTEELLRSTFLDMFGDPVTNPKGWEKVKLNAIVKKIDSGWSPKCDSREADSDEWGVLKLGAVTLGHFNSSENKALLPETEPCPELEVKEGDLLFSRKNTYELVGATAYVHRTREKLLLPDLIFRLCLSAKVDPVYLWQALSRKTMRNELSRLASGSSGSMPNISKTRLKNLLVPIPPLDLQLKYKEAVNRFSRCQESQQKNTLEAENLFNSLLQKAFRGEL